MTPDTDPASPAAPPQKKPRLAFLLATWFGLGYLPKAPGTWGSFAGLALTWLIVQLAPYPSFWTEDLFIHGRYFVVAWNLPAALCLIVACVGVWASSHVAAFTHLKDPQFVVIDEVSGQMLTFLWGVPRTMPYFFGTLPFAASHWSYVSLKWTVLLAGFLLFRLFDIWKPFPIRRLEKLPGGWGIMADDWLAGIYAAILLRLALHFNLL